MVNFNLRQTRLLRNYYAHLIWWRYGLVMLLGKSSTINLQTGEDLLPTGQEQVNNNGCSKVKKSSDFVNIV